MSKGKMLLVVLLFIVAVSIIAAKCCHGPGWVEPEVMQKSWDEYQRLAKEHPAQ